MHQLRHPVELKAPASCTLLSHALHKMVCSESRLLLHAPSTHASAFSPDPDSSHNLCATVGKLYIDIMPCATSVMEHLISIRRGAQRPLARTTWLQTPSTSELHSQPCATSVMEHHLKSGVAHRGPPHAQHGYRPQHFRVTASMAPFVLLALQPGDTTVKRHYVVCAIRKAIHKRMLVSVRLKG
jgi:hypothetical protein